ncbi:uncharacterized protein LOC119659332 [Hermetia illucens]|uniref:uncharacterized protein LOC119659332 n=1 Tax=Hermetia illucens TaxID=343691 RepID=UPI0018CC68A5|nr:uncharacterized protein LOC119659332 [Hermetia illucens]
MHSTAFIISVRRRLGALLSDISSNAQIVLISAKTSSTFKKGYSSRTSEDHLLNFDTDTTLHFKIQPGTQILNELYNYTLNQLGKQLSLSKPQKIHLSTEIISQIFLEESEKHVAAPLTGLLGSIIDMIGNNTSLRTLHKTRKILQLRENYA